MIQVVALSANKERSACQCKFPGGGIPSLDWPGEMHLNCAICVFGCKSQHNFGPVWLDQSETGFKIICGCLGQIFWNRVWIRETMKPAPEADSLDIRWRTAMSKGHWKLKTIFFINFWSKTWQKLWKKWHFDEIYLDKLDEFRHLDKGGVYPGGGGGIPSLDWPGEIHTNCVILVFQCGHHHCSMTTVDFRMWNNLNHSLFILWSWKF